MDFNFLNKKITLSKCDHDNQFLEQLISALPNTARVLEVGAFKGTFSKLLLEKFSDVLIIEGQEGNYSRLIKKFPNYKDKILNAIVYKDDNEHYWYHEDGSAVNAVRLPLPKGKKLKWRYNSGDISGLVKNKVFTKSLSSLNYDFDFIKLDCEGADFPIILGADNLIDKMRPLIYFEHSAQIGANTHRYDKETFFNFFRQKKYSLFLANTEPYLENMWFTDISTVNKSYNILAVPND